MENNQQEKTKGGNMPRLAFFSSHCFIPLFLLVVFIITFLSYFLSSSEGPFYSQNAELNNSLIPTYLIQLSDLHFNHYMPERVQRNTQKLQAITSFFNPPILIITGDIVDSLDSSNALNFHHRSEGNWNAWNQSYYQSGIRNISDLLFIPISGNHDNMAIPADNKEEHPFRAYFLTDEQETTFQEYTINPSTQGSPINFIAFNPITPPSPSGMLCMMPFVYDETIQELKNKVKNNHINILMNHFPRNLLWSDTDSSGKSVREATSHYDLMLAGHTHPMVQEISRKDGLLHVTASAYHTDNVTLITFDNNQINVHNIYPFTNEQIVVTYPISSKSLTSKTVFNKNSFDIRAIYFSHNIDETLICEIDSRVIGSLTYKETIRENALLYTLQLSNISNGHHTMSIRPSSSNNPNQTYRMDFFVGDEFEKIKTSFSISSNYMSGLAIGLTAFITLYNLIRITPLWLIPQIKEILNDFDEYVEGKVTDLPGWKVFAYSCLDFITRFRRMTALSFWTLVFLNLWYFFIPLFISPVEYKTAAVFVWGAVIDGHLRYHLMTFAVWMLYLLLFVMPIGSFAALRGEKYRTIWEAVIYIIVFIVALIIWFIVANFSGAVLSIFGSPLTYIAIASIIIVFVDAFYCKKSNQKTENSESSSSSSDGPKQEL